MTMAAMATVTATRWRPSPDQLMILEEIYMGGIKTPSAGQIQRITAHLSLYGKIECKNVFYWFQNHKAREKQKIRKRLLLGKQLCRPLRQQQPPSSHLPPLVLPGHHHLQCPPPHAILRPQYNFLYLVEPAAHAQYDCGLLQHSHQHGRVASCGNPQTQDGTWIRLSCTDKQAAAAADALMTPAAAATPPPTLDPSDDSSSATSTAAAAATTTNSSATRALETLQLFPTTSATGLGWPEAPPQVHHTPAAPLSLSLALTTTVTAVS